MATIQFKRNPFLEDKKVVFIIIHKDGYISYTTKNTFKVSKARPEAKRYRNWQSALKAARKCRAFEIQECWDEDIRIVTRRYAVDLGGDHDDVRY